MKECKLSDLIFEGWAIKEIETLKAYDREGHLLWELYTKEKLYNKRKKRLIRRKIYEF